MKVPIRLSMALPMTFLLLVAGASAEEIRRSFDNVERIEMKGVSGDFVLSRTSGSSVRVVLPHNYPEDSHFDPSMEMRGSKLVLREDFRSRDGEWKYDRRHNARIEWTVQVPEGVEIEFGTASGNLTASDLQSDIRVSTASGDVELKKIDGSVRVSTASGSIELEDIAKTNRVTTASGTIRVSKISGEVEITAASGDIELEEVDGEFRVSVASGRIGLRNSKGQFRMAAASGDIRVDNVDITGESRFSAASGDIDVRLRRATKYDLELNTGSGDIHLDFGNDRIVGTVEMTARKGRTKVRAPLDFKESDGHRSDWGRRYVTQIAKRGDGPYITLKTGSGRVVLAGK